MDKPAVVSIPSPFTDRIREKARDLGFDAIGFARADVPLDADFARYEAFVAAGMHGEMAYLARDRDVRRRLDTDAILGGAKSVVCLARRYDRGTQSEAEDPPLAQKIARYARGRDYHNGVRKKLRKLAAFIRTLADGAEARPIADDIPVLERAWAARAGLGFVGKNGMLIVPGQGSFVLLGEVITTLPLAPSEPIADRCGACTLCITACPTDAIVRDRVIDPRRCISYLTIEHRSPIPVELREGIGDHLFGCDDCQSICPWNRDSQTKREGRADAKLDVFSPHAHFAETTLADLLNANADQFRAVTEGSPLRRATHIGLARNAAIVLGNEGAKRRADGTDGAGTPLSRADVDALQNAANSHESETVRDAATWALARISKG